MKSFILLLVLLLALLLLVALAIRALYRYRSGQVSGSALVPSTEIEKTTGSFGTPIRILLTLVTIVASLVVFFILWLNLFWERNEDLIGKFMLADIAIAIVLLFIIWVARIKTIILVFAVAAAGATIAIIYFSFRFIYS